MGSPMIEARGADGTIELISEQEYYMRIALEMPESDDRACHICRGAGYVRYERNPGDALFGKYTTCRRCVGQQATDATVAPAPAPWRKDGRYGD